MIRNTKHEILTIVMEECAEIQVECSKIMRFDSDSKKLEMEIGDLICLLGILNDRHMIDFDEIEKQIPRKRKKLEKWSNIFKGESNE